MTTRTKIYIIAAVLFLTSVGLNIYLLTGTDTPTAPATVAETPTTHTLKPGTDPGLAKSCGEITITGAWVGDRKFRVTAINSVEIAQKTFEFSLPERRIKHVFALGLLGGGDYFRGRERVYAMYGAELDYLRMYDRLGIGGGVWYKQSIIDRRAADAGIKFMVAVGI